MPSIGKLALQIVADATDFIGTIEKVQKKVGAFVADLSSLFARGFKIITNPFSTIEAGLQSFFDLAATVFKVTRLGPHNYWHSNRWKWAYLVCRAPKGVKSDAYVSSSLGTNCSRNGSRWSTVFRASFGAVAYPWHADCRE